VGTSVFRACLELEGKILYTSRNKKGGCLKKKKREISSQKDSGQDTDHRKAWTEKTKPEEKPGMKRKCREREA